MVNGGSARCRGKRVIIEVLSRENTPLTEILTKIYANQRTKIEVLMR